MEKFLKIFGESVTASLDDRQKNSSDGFCAPEAFINRFVNPLPDLVAAPVDTEEAAEMIRLAAEEGLPVIPRGGGTTCLGGSVPAEGGLTLSTGKLKHMEVVDPEECVVMVDAGVTWYELERWLNDNDMALRSHPYGAGKSTVGGWFSLGGLGPGTLLYGIFSRLVEEAEVITPDGEVHVLDARTVPSLNRLAGSEGTLGFVTSLLIKARPKPEVSKCFTFSFSRVFFCQKAVARVEEELGDFVYDIELCPITGMGPAAEQMPGANKGALSMGVVIDGTPGEVRAAGTVLRETVEGLGGVFLGMQDLGGGMVTFFDKTRREPGLQTRLLIPLGELGHYLRRCERSAELLKGDISSVCRLVNKDQLLVHVSIKSSLEGGLAFLADLSLLKKVHEICLGMGGKPYGIGLWNLPYLDKTNSSSTLSDRKKLKLKLDPDNRMNPGKFYEPPMFLHPFLVNLVSGAMIFYRRFLKKADDLS